MSAMLDTLSLQKAASNVKTLIRNVKCLVCSKIFQNPRIGDCGHTACSTCWSSTKICQICGLKSSKNLRLDYALSTRTQAIVRFAENFQNISGLNVLERSSSDESVNIPKQKESSEELFKDITKKYSKKYERKKAADSTLPSQQSTLIFPGEEVTECFDKPHVRKDDSLSSSKKVAGWLENEVNDFHLSGNSDEELLSVSQVKNKSNFYSGPVRIDFTKKVNPDFFKKRQTPNKNQSHNESQPSKSNAEIDFDEIQVISSEYIDEISDDLEAENKQHSSNFDGNRKKHNLRRPRVVSNDSITEVHDNSPPKLSTSAIHDIIGIPQEKALNSSDEVKNKNTWENVKKMKKTLKNKSAVKKLNISIENHAAVMGKERVSSEKVDKTTPYVIENYSSLHDKNSFVDEIDVAPCDLEVVQNHNSKQSSVIILDMPSSSDTYIDKDRLALQEVAKRSKEPIVLSMSSSLPPLQAAAAIDASANDKSLRKDEEIIIVSDEFIADSKIKTSRPNSSVVKDILNDFDVGNMKMDVEYSHVRSLSMQRDMKKPKRNAMSLIEHKIYSESTKTNSETMKHDQYSRASTERNKKSYLSGGNTVNKQHIPFFYGSKLNKINSVKKVKKIPFFYKSNCISKDWYKAPQDGVNIEICRDNVITSIVVRNQPLVDNILDDKHSDMKIVNTRDAQTSPITKHKNCHVARNETNLSIPAVIESNNPTDYDDIFDKDSEVVSSSEGAVNLFRDNACGVDHIYDNELNVELKKGLTENENIIRLTNDEMKKKAFILDRSKTSHTDNTLNINDPMIAAGLTEQNSSVLTPTRRNTDSTQINNIENSKVYENVAETSILVIDSSDIHSQISGSTLNTSRVKRSRCTAGPSDVSLTKKLKLDGAYDEKMPVNNDVIIQFESQPREENKDCNSEPMNYDDIIGPVFADIDNETKQKSSRNFNKTIEDDERNFNNSVSKSTSISKTNPATTNKLVEVELYKEDIVDRTDLRYVSMDIDNSLRSSEVIFETQRFPQKNVLLKKNPPINIVSKRIEENVIIDAAPSDKCTDDRLDTATPNVDSDNSVVEDTPQKPRKTTFIKRLTQRSNSTSSISADKQTALNKNNSFCEKRLSILEEEGTSFVNEVNERTNSNLTNLGINMKEKDSEKQTITRSTAPTLRNNSDGKTVPCNRSDTPLSITQFNNAVTYRSTPVTMHARRSLTYNALPNVTEEKSVLEDSGTGMSSGKENVNSYKSPAHMKSRIENEFLDQAFDSSTNSTPKLSTNSSDGRRSSILFAPRTERIPSTENSNLKKTNVNTKSFINEQSMKTISRVAKNSNIVIACSCLNNQAIASVKLLVSQRGWRFSNAYTQDLTHLIVKVDDSKKSQRSVKYMRSLAAGLWILTIDWVLECLKTQSRINEVPYEVLDSTGHPGPFVSRTRPVKIFNDMTFFCFPPFAILDIDILSEIITNAGGEVVEKFDSIKIKDPKKINFVLGELDNTQDDDRFVNICIQYPVVPLNIEWALDSLGTGEIIPINNWLLGPRPLLPKVNWPKQLFPDEDDCMDSEKPI